MTAVNAVGRVELKQMHGQLAQLVTAHEAATDNGSLAAFTALQTRIEVVEQAVKDLAVAGGPLGDPAVAADPFACGLAGVDAGTRPGMPAVACFSTAHGGNGICYRVHLMTLGEKLLPDRVHALGTRADTFELSWGPAGRALPSRTFVPGQASHGGPGELSGGVTRAVGVPFVEPAGGTQFDPTRPLRRRAIGPLANEKTGMSLFDDKPPDSGVQVRWGQGRSRVEADAQPLRAWQNPSHDRDLQMG